MSDLDKFYITTPIYYVNDRPHIGHAYTTILADVLARYHRLLNRPTFFLTGTDEHGQKVYEAARRSGIEPLEHCDRTVVRFRELWSKLEITHDDFIRTTEPRHSEVVKSILADLYRRDEIFADDYEGWYCVACERFFTEKDLVRENCPECGRSVDKLVERNYFFRMSKYQDWLIGHIESNPEFIQPAHRRQETLGFLRGPLGDLCISRPKTRMSWGIELPFDRDYVTYVWFDALVNYISAIGYLADDEKFSTWWPASCHLIGKDILTTHTVYWPIMLKAIGLPMPQSIFAHGWWLVGRDKMSKSLGNVVNPMEIAEDYGVDPFRYFLMAEMAMGQDASFTESAFFSRYNSDLANDLGNLASRVSRMIERNLDGRLPASAMMTAAEERLGEVCLGAVTAMREHLAVMRIDRGLAGVMTAVREGNRYFEQNAPWQMARNGDLEGLRRVLFYASECLRIVAGLLFPVMPGKMTDLRQALGIPTGEIEPDIEKLAVWGLSRPDEVKVCPLAALFPRIDPATALSASASSTGPGDKAAAGGNPVTGAVGMKGSAKHKEALIAAGAEQEGTGLLEIADFARLDLRTARVVAAESIAGTDKLLRLQVEMGGETRQIVAGLARFYKPSQLLGRSVILVANLKPAIIRGVESQGMLLAARQDCGRLTLITVENEVPSGCPVG